ncbi:sensor domain-containing diguanylate cyclase [Salibacterium aidingense]|uniref:sensor domain-containing diguanylate cyclase n=1 Tax=Salibacterium aidingense TaxID=384933 RepID=UPI003BED867D
MENNNLSSEESAQYRKMWKDVLCREDVQELLAPCTFFLKRDNGEVISTYTEGTMPSLHDLERYKEESLFAEEEKGFTVKDRLWKAGAVFQAETSAGSVFQGFLTALVPSLKKWMMKTEHKEESSEDKRYELMIQVTKKFHSSMKADAVLKEIVKSLEFIYPSSRIALHLAQDWKVHTDLAHIDCSFGFQGMNEKMKQTYLLGQIQMEDTENFNVSVLYIPLLGKQGVYGVLSMEAPETLVNNEKEREYMKMLADTGGNALENAELYQQSRTLIKDLQLINETSHILNSRLKIEETVESMETQIEKFIPESRQGYILTDEIRNLRVLKDDYFKEPERLEMIFHVMDRFEHNQEAVFIGDLERESMYDVEGYRSMMAVPMIQSNELKGAVLVLGEIDNAFTFHQFKLLQSLVHHSTLAFINATLHEKLENLVITDHLTKLHSRHFLDQRVGESIRTDIQGTFLLFDIDNFKEINDSYGHQTGDSIIVQVGRIIEENIRTGDVAARWGGEELAVYLPCASAPAGRKVADRIVRHVEKASNPAVTISCGAATWTREEEMTLDELFLRADQALYRAKRSGKNQVVYEI